MLHVAPTPAIVMLELNELTPVLLERFMASGALPNFRRLYESSTIYTTDAGEDPPNLEPWIAWPSVHVGVSQSEHGAFLLGDGRKIAAKGVARVLSDAGVRVGVFGSMNTNYERLVGYYLPDPWEVKGKPEPAELEAFTAFVARAVADSSREAAGFDRAAALAFVRFLATHGLSLATLLAILGQLVAERRDPSVRWRRAMLLDAMSYDVFRNLNRRYDVAFATFFSNSVAHFQHYHWRDMEPEVFEHPLEAGAPPSHAQMIREGYIANDALVGRALADYPDATIVFATALSQQPWKETAKCVYRPHDFGAFLRFAGFGPEVRVEPVMAEEFRLVGGDVRAIVERLATLSIDGAPLMKSHILSDGVQTGCLVFDGAPSMLGRSVRAEGGAVAAFGDLFYRLSSMRSGRHHRDGALWIRDGAPHRVHADRVPLERIAPTILDRFGIEAPAHMRGAPLPPPSEPLADTARAYMASSARA